MALTRNPQSRTTWWIVAGIAGIALLALGAFLFVSSFTTGRALDEAEGLRTTDLTLAADDVAMKAIGQLVLVAEEASFQLASAADAEAAASEAQRTVSELGARFENLDAGTQEELSPAYNAWREAAVAVIAQATSGEAEQAQEALSSTLAPASDRFVAALSAERDKRARAVAAAGDSASSVSRVFGFLTIFFIPLIAILAYWFAARRQLREAATHLDARIEAERSVGRAKDRFIADVSQELRGPLASIGGFSETLLDRGLVDPHASDLVGLINRESAALARKAENLLVAAHDEGLPLPLEFEVLDMEKQIHEVIAPFERHGHFIGGTRGAGLVRADELRVRQILRNLVVNAVEHGGPDIRIYGDTAGSRYVVSVEDNGPGVPGETVDRLVIRSSRDNAPLTAGSAGLGLAVAHSLARALGGSLDYDRVANRTALILSLPLANGESAETTAAAER